MFILADMETDSGLRRNGFRKLNEGVEFGEGFAVIKRGGDLNKRRFEITRFGGEGASGVEQNGVAARAFEFAREKVAHHRRGFVGRAAAQIFHGGEGKAEFGGIEIIGVDRAIFEMTDAIDCPWC